MQAPVGAGAHDCFHRSPVAKAHERKGDEAGASIMHR
jgi:hypothetical protein